MWQPQTRKTNMKYFKWVTHRNKEQWKDCVRIIILQHASERKISFFSTNTTRILHAACYWNATFCVKFDTKYSQPAIQKYEGEWNKFVSTCFGLHAFIDVWGCLLAGFRDSTQTPSLLLTVVVRKKTKVKYLLNRNLPIYNFENWN